MSNRTSRFLALFAALALVLAACGNDDNGDPADEPGSPDAASDLPLVVVTTSILGDVVATLVAEDAEVEVLMPIGADPHDFELSARQAASLRDADLVVANGLQLEIGLIGALEGAAGDGVTIIEVAEFLTDPVAFGDHGHSHDDDDHGHEDDDHGHSHDDGHGHEDDDHGHDDDDHGHEDDDHGHGDDDHGHSHDDGHDDDDHAHSHDDDDHGHGDFDPHFWHDPSRMVEVLPGLADALAAALPELDADDLEERVESLVDELLTVDTEIEEILDAVPAERRYLVTNHDSFAYLADRYGFEVIGVVIPGGDTLAQPSPGDLAGLVAEIEHHELPAVFAESIIAPTLAEALADEAAIDVEVVSLYTDSLGEAGSGAETYAGMLRTNAQLIVDALG